MCGISGFYDESIKNNDANRLMNQMLESISHRGPDNRSIHSEGALTLGHNRLTIIDLSDTANQPMIKGNLKIVFNGEIYNYLEIRKELVGKGYQFVTNGDTEVILNSYLAWGTKCVTRFVGMWAFAIWDSNDNSLFCSRDRFGIKPFLYICESNKFYFASEYKPLKYSPLYSNDLNLNQIKRGLQLGWVVYQDETYFSKIKALPESSNLIFKNGKITIEKYWEPDLMLKSDLTFEEKREKFSSMFSESIDLHMRSDVEVGACLSGGLDSSSITSLVGKKFPDVNFKTFTIFYQEENAVDERPWVNSVIEKYPQISNYTYSPVNDDLRECFHKMCFHLDAPTNWSSDISQYYVMQLAAKHKMKVLLDGQGSDEYLSGYMHTFYRQIGNLTHNLKFGKALNLLKDYKSQQNLSSGKSFDVLLKSGLSSMFNEQQLYSLEYKYFQPWLSKDKNKTAPFNLEKKSPNKVDNFLYHLLFNTLLPSLLHFEDRNSMAFSIESRVPFLDHRLVEFGLSLSNEDKIQNGVTKFILRESMKGILPEMVSNRKDKKGFTTPGALWLRTDMKFLLDQDFSKLEMLDQNKIQSLIKEFKAGNNNLAHILWRVGGLNYWLNNFV